MCLLRVWRPLIVFLAAPRHNTNEEIDRNTIVNKYNHMWTCPDCEAENADTAKVCECCDCERPAAGASPAAAAAGGDADPLAGIVVGKILECESLPGDKARKLLVDVGDAAAVTIVTTAPNVAVGLKVVVAKPGATVKDVLIKTATVYGVPSQGMLCDGATLGWKGGGSGAAVVPDSYACGATPPTTRPRLDGQ